MSSTLRDRLKANFERALDEGRNVLILVARVRLNGDTVKELLAGLSNREKKNRFNTTQIRQIEDGNRLEDMDITLLNAVIMAFGNFAEYDQCYSLVRKLKNIRNEYIHELHMLDFSKTMLKERLVKLKDLYTEILQELKRNGNPTLVNVIDHSIADVGSRLLMLENTLDDHIQERTADLTEASAIAARHMTALNEGVERITEATNEAFTALRMQQQLQQEQHQQWEQQQQQEHEEEPIQQRQQERHQHQSQQGQQNQQLVQHGEENIVNRNDGPGNLGPIPVTIQEVPNIQQSGDHSTVESQQGSVIPLPLHESGTPSPQQGTMLPAYQPGPVNVQNNIDQRGLVLAQGYPGNTQLTQGPQHTPNQTHYNVAGGGAVTNNVIHLAPGATLNLDHKGSSQCLIM